MPTGRTWTVGGAAIGAGGAFALDIDSAGTDFTGTVSAGNGSWSARFGVAGDGPVSAAGVASGPSPVVVDSTVEVFRLPISVRGTPGKNMSVTVGTPSSSALSTAKLVASVHGQGSGSETSTQAATRIAENTIRAAVAFTLVGWLLLAIVPGLRARTYRTMRSGSLRRLGLGAVFALDVPLAALLLAVIGVPLGLWWVGLVALALFAATAVAGYAYAGFQIGALLLARPDRPRLMWMLEVPLGVLLLVLAGQIPYAGPVISILAVFYGIGSLLYRPAEAGETAVRAERPALIPSGSPQRPLVS